MKRVVTFILLLVLSSTAYSQAQYTDADKVICNSKFHLAVERSLEKRPINSVLAEIGKSFIGTDYIASTLDNSDSEKLVINLTGLDCTTFLENTLVFARLIKSGKSSFDDYQNELMKVRYRKGIINKYPSRLHYFSDWIYDNSQKHVIIDVTKEIGGVLYPLKVGFMTKNRDKYRQISNNDEFFTDIKKVESEINSREYFYIPKSEVAKHENKIEDGYLIAVTTNIDGLDISHVGIAVKGSDQRIHLLHAPIAGSKVQITEKPLAEYLAGNKKQTGIIVLKPLEP